MKFDLKKLRNVIIKKVILVALIIITSIVLGVIGNFADAFANQANVDAGFDVMKGNTSTVEGIAMHKLTAGSLETGKVITTVILFILCFVFVTDICIDVYNFKKKEEK